MSNWQPPTFPQMRLRPRIGKRGMRGRFCVTDSGLARRAITWNCKFLCCLTANPLTDSACPAGKLHRPTEFPERPVARQLQFGLPPESVQNHRSRQAAVLLSDPDARTAPPADVCHEPGPSSKIC